MFRLIDNFKKFFFIRAYQRAQIKTFRSPCLGNLVGVKHPGGTLENTCMGEGTAVHKLPKFERAWKIFYLQYVQYRPCHGFRRHLDE